jgi:HEAT repeat protein
VLQRTRLINLDQNFRVHDRKVYWLGDSNADESVTLLMALIKESPKSSSSLAHYMTLHDSPAVADRLLELARNETNTQEVRRSAIQWLGREVSRRAGEELARLTTDPDTEIQKQAVIAISRRNADEAIPALIKTARDHPNVAVRKQAITLLGQKRDPRVLDFFEQALKTK